MEETYDFKKVEPAIARVWDKKDFFAPSINRSQRPYSMYLIPPNASGPMHVGNALMIAIQDVLARYHRAKGEPTLWVPGTDHGGYETQVTYEQELEKTGKKKSDLNNKELYDSIKAFVEKNNETIIRQTKALGASVDWSHFRFTLDEASLAFVNKMFTKMIADNLVYRSSYMVNYCTSCATVLADIELKEVSVNAPLYFIKFPFKDRDGHLSLATTRPEFIFTVTHVLGHPNDAQFAELIGTTLVNPVTGEDVEVVKSKRKFDPKNPEPFLLAFTPSAKRYDFEYALRNGIPTRDLFDWEGRMLERYLGAKPDEARTKEVEFLKEKDAIERVDDAHTDEAYVCKKGHVVHNIIRMSWFVKLDDENKPLRKPALDALFKEKPIIIPRWREKGLTEWIQKMHDWPIARQNVWGIKIPIWYEISDPQLFTVWFLDAKGVRRYGNLQTLLDEGVGLGEIEEGLERIYAAEGSTWALAKEEGKTYLPETDTFDTWFSSGAWSAMVFDTNVSKDLSYFYPNSIVVIGYDLLRLSIAREIMLGQYLTGKLPFRRVYFHSLLKSKDGQKMSKSLGNAVTLDHYLEKFGADVTRMGLLSYTGQKEDFYFADEKLEAFKAFTNRLWTMGKVSDTVHMYSIEPYNQEQLTAEDKNLLDGVEALGATVGGDIEKYFLAQAQEKVVAFLEQFEAFAAAIQEREDDTHAVAVFNAAFNKYITTLHPFAPFITEELYAKVYKSSRPLAATLVKPVRR